MIYLITNNKKRYIKSISRTSCSSFRIKENPVILNPAPTTRCCIVAPTLETVTLNVYTLLKKT
jgi:hypothetical protein